MTKTETLKLTLRDIVKTRKGIESLMSTLEIKDVQRIFGNNPVFWEGTSDPDENTELENTDRFNYLLDMLSKTHTHLLRAQELMLRLGIHHVRLEAGERVPQKMEKENKGSPHPPT